MTFHVTTLSIFFNITWDAWDDPMKPEVKTLTGKTITLDVEAGGMGVGWYLVFLLIVFRFWLVLCSPVRLVLPEVLSFCQGKRCKTQCLVGLFLVSPQQIL